MENFKVDALRIEGQKSNFDSFEASEIEITYKGKRFRVRVKDSELQEVDGLAFEEIEEQGISTGFIGNV